MEASSRQRKRGRQTSPYPVKDGNNVEINYIWKEVEGGIINGDEVSGYRAIVGATERNDVGTLLVTTITNRHAPKTTAASVTKRLDPFRIDLSLGNPTFTFVLEGTDVYGNEIHQEKAISFSRSDQSLAKDQEGYISKTATFGNLRYGSYKLYEKDPTDCLYYSRRTKTRFFSIVMFCVIVI